MPSVDIPLLGQLVLSLVLVAAMGTVGLAAIAHRGQGNVLVATRYGVYVTSGLIVFALCLLGYAFQTHDYRIGYVARYSDRSMSWSYLVTSLWGGQDGSILFWSFLLAIYSSAVTYRLKGRLLELQPALLGTLMSIVVFFAVLMLFPADPFAIQQGTTPIDGEGLNPLLQNYWMKIHPPSLYLGFVGWSVPFSFASAALITGRLDDEWLEAARPWAMIAWTFLSIGLLLGCLWSYEELGWGGYWAWDPVENASFMPWLVGTAYLHSAVVQKRRGILRGWTAFLLCLTFFMTIFGTFLTRSGLIASVHSFAKSDIGNYFGVYLVLLALGIVGLLAYRMRDLASPHGFDALLSREFAFFFNNWILLSMMLFVAGATMFPWLSEKLYGEEQTVGPPFYNLYMPFLGLVLLFLTGLGPLLAWRRTTAQKLSVALRAPGLAALAVLGLHVSLGSKFGYPAYVTRPPLNDNVVGIALAKASSALPCIATSLVAFVLVAIAQEFVRGTRARMRVRGESAGTALVTLVSRARRTYGGYVVHAGVALIYLGFTGAAWDYEREGTLLPGAELRVGAYTLRYVRPRMTVDAEKRIVSTEVRTFRDGRPEGTATPARFIYRLRPEMPTTEPHIARGVDEDLYLTMSSVDPSTRRATFKATVRPLVDWIWMGGSLGVLGSLLAMFPDVRTLVRKRKPSSAPARGLRLALALLALAFVFVPTFALGQSSEHAGHVHLDSLDERTLFPRLLCQCGSCPRLPLDSCICDWAEQKRGEIRQRLDAGETVGQVQRSYAATYGRRAISVPDDQGSGRALWAAPFAVSVSVAAGLFVLGRRLRARGAAEARDAAAAMPTVPTGTDLDEKLDAALERFEEHGE